MRENSPWQGNVELSAHTYVSLRLCDSENSCLLGIFWFIRMFTAKVWNMFKWTFPVYEGPGCQASTSLWQTVNCELCTAKWDFTWCMELVHIHTHFPSCFHENPHNTYPSLSMQCEYSELCYAPININMWKFPFTELFEEKSYFMWRNWNCF